MFRVYYLVNSMDQVKTALKNIEQSEIGTNRVHVMAVSYTHLTLPTILLV